MSEEIKESEPNNADVHQKLAESLGPDQRNVFDHISGKYSYDPQVSWKCNLGRILWYVNREFKTAFDCLNYHSQLYMEQTDVSIYSVL